jgi:sugar (pentulose or hexulose) kinase
MIADACARPVIAGPVEAAALGNAMMQALATGHLGSLEEGREAIKNSMECAVFASAADKGWHDAFANYKTAVCRGREMVRMAGTA